MIYGRFGNEVEIVRRATLADIQTLDNRKVDKLDRDALRDGLYLEQLER